VHASIHTTRSRRCARRVGAALAFAFLALGADARAQSPWLDRSARRSLDVESDFSTFDHSSVSTWFVTVRAPVGATVHFVGELPYSRAGVQQPLMIPVGPGYGYSGFAADALVGNPYLGFEFVPRTGPFWTEVGVRAPIVTENHALSYAVAWAPSPVGPASLDPYGVEQALYDRATIAGTLADFDREEAFLPNQLPVRVAFHYGLATRTEPALQLDLHGAPVIMFRVHEDPLLEDEQIDIGYGATLRVVGRRERICAGIVRRWTAFGQVTTSAVGQLDMAADFLVGAVRPGLRVRVPLHDLEHRAGVSGDGSVGLALSANLGGTH
jgi:hypothetical protein